MRDFPFSEDMIKCMIENPDLYHWENISYNIKLSEEFIDKFKDYLFWGSIFEFQNLSKIFIKEHLNYIQWQRLFKNKELDIEEALEFEDQINWFNWVFVWRNISYSNNLSIAFIAKHISKLHPDLLLKNENLSEETKNYIRMFI